MKVQYPYDESAHDTTSSPSRVASDYGVRVCPEILHNQSCDIVDNSGEQIAKP